MSRLPIIPRRMGWLLLVLPLLLTGCGGGGGMVSPPGPPAPSPNAPPGVQVQNGSLVVQTPSMQVSFRGVAIQSFTNHLTGETQIQSANPGVVELNLQDPTGTLLQPGTWSTRTDSVTGSRVGVLQVSDAQRQVSMTVGWDSASDEIFIRFSARSSKPGVRALIWGIPGFNPSGRFLIPAQAGIQFDSQTNPAAFSFSYPTHWESQFVIYESAAGGTLLYARDPKPLFKRLDGTRQAGTLDLTLWTLAQGPWASATEVPEVEWRLKAFRGDWRGAVDTYRAWSQTVFPARTPDSRRDWAKQVRAVVTVVEPDTNLLDKVALELDPAKTLIYLVHWRAEGFDVNYPDYTAMPETMIFVQRAHTLGFHVMLHTSAVGVTPSNPVFNSISQFQLRDPDSGDLLFWPFGLWPAGPPPPALLQSFAFISPASSAYRAIFVQAMRDVVQNVQPDALHLDAGGVMLNDGNGLIEGLTSIEGMIQLHRDLAQEFPQILFGYESETESLASLHGFAQRWNADFPGHPVSSYLMRDTATFYGFLDQPNPGEARFIEFIRRYETQGILPTLTVHADGYLIPDPDDPPILNVLQLWQQHDFKPDWSGDWTGQRFRHISADGRTTASVLEDAQSVRLVVGGQTIYKRARNVTSTSTTSFIPHWTAYDSSTLFGLDPQWEYWLQDQTPRPAGALHLSGLPAGVKLGSGTLAAADYGYFELEPVPQASFNFFLQFLSAKVGMNPGGSTDFRPASGASAQVSQAQVGGRQREPVIVMQPPFGLALGAATFVEYDLPVPATPSLLDFGVGLSDLGTRSDGASFKVTVNGAQVWRKDIAPGEWLPIQVDLSAWAGQSVKLRLLVHPGPALNPVDDICVWGDFGITARPSTAPVAFQVGVPDPTVVPSATTGTQLTPTADPLLYNAAAVIPARFAVFARPPQAINVGGSLLDLPFEVWKQSYKGYPFRFRFGQSGDIRPVASGGSVMSRAVAVEPSERAFTLVTWGVQLPGNASQLSFDVGLADPPTPVPVQYSGVEFSLLINGQQQWNTIVETQGWTHHTLDLTPWQGQKVVITLRVDSLGSAILDSANWSDLSVH